MNTKSEIISRANNTMHYYYNSCINLCSYMLASEWILNRFLSRLKRFYSLLIISFSRLKSFYSLLKTLFSRLKSFYSLLKTSFSRLKSFYSLLKTLFSRLKTFYSLPKIIEGRLIKSKIIIIIN